MAVVSSEIVQPRVQALRSRWGEIVTRVSLSSEGERPLALLLHGGHGSWRHWETNLPKLSSHFDLVVPDLPGFGESCDIPSDSALTDIAQGLNECVIDAFSRPADLIVGFSFGSLVAATLANTEAALSNRRQHRPAVVLVNPPLGRDVSPEVIAIIEEATMKVRGGGLEAGIEHTLRAIMLSDHSLITPLLIEQACEQARQARFGSRRVSRSTDIRPLLVPLAGRCDLILGAQDPHQQASLVERLPHYRQVLGVDRVHVVPDAAHWLQYDRPRAFNDIVHGVAQRLRAWPG